MTAPEVSGWPDKATVERAAEAMSVAETKWFHAPPPSADPGDTSDYFPTLARAALSVLPDPTADTVLLAKVRGLFTDTEVHSAALMQRVVNVLEGDHPEAFITQIESDRQQVRNLVGDWFDDYNLADRFIGDLDRAGFQIERKADAIAALLAGGGE